MWVGESLSSAGNDSIHICISICICICAETVSVFVFLYLYLRNIWLENQCRWCPPATSIFVFPFVVVFIQKLYLYLYTYKYKYNVCIYTCERRFGWRTSTVVGAHRLYPPRLPLGSSNIAPLPGSACQCVKIFCISICICNCICV